MNPAEFQCSREYLGLPVIWVAEKLGVDRRTVYRWENEKTTLPDWASQTMREWVARTNRAVNLVTLEVLRHNDIPLEATSDDFDGMAEEGFPASWQRMLCARAAERTGRPIRWMNIEDAQAAIVSEAMKGGDRR